MGLGVTLGMLSDWGGTRYDGDILPDTLDKREREGETRCEQKRVVRTTVPRKAHVRTFRSMDLNVRRRLGLRRQRDDDDQHVLVEHHRRLSTVICTKLSSAMR